MFPRFVPMLAALLILGACVSTPDDVNTTPILTLDGNGMVEGTTRLRVDFGRTSASSVAAFSRVLGENPVEISQNPECGAGPMSFARFEDGLTLNFLNGNFVGWTTTDPAIPVVDGFRPGQPRTQMAEASFQVTTLGTEFSRTDIYGVMDDTTDTIDTIWAGTTCFFR
jgi:hypothetical protein